MQNLKDIIREACELSAEDRASLRICAMNLKNVLGQIQTDSGNSALKIACKNNHLALAEFLISKGADINSQSEEKGTTPLHAAAYRGHLDLVMLLLKHGAKIDLRTKKGNTPLMLARKKKYHDVVKALQRARAGTTEIDF